MKKIIKSLIKKYFLSLYKLIKGLKFLYAKNSYLNQTGFMKSLATDKISDADGNAIPWMNYNIVNFLKDRLTKDLVLFEYGSGASSEFYCKYTKEVVSIEHNKDWFDMISETFPSNGKILFIEYDEVNKTGIEYSTAIQRTNKKWDVIVVDGRDRVNCIKNSINSLSSSGVLILDDSSRVKYIEGFVFMKNNGYKHITFTGLKSTGFTEDSTTIFYKNDNCFQI